MTAQVTPIDFGSDISRHLATDATTQTGSRVTETDALVEARVLATVLSHGFVGDDLESLSASMFSVPLHAHLWTAMMELDRAGRPIDTVTACDAMERSGVLGQRSPVPFIESIATTGTVLNDLGEYQRIITDRASRRNVLAACARISQYAHDGASGIILAERAQSEIFAATTQHAQEQYVSMSELAGKVHALISSPRSGALMGVASGFPMLDELTSGFSAGQLIIVGARPGVGKSILLLQMARTIASNTGKIVPFYSYEMNATEIGFRILSSMTKIPLTRLMSGREFDYPQQRALATAAEEMGKLPLIIIDNPPPGVAGVRSAARKLARNGELGAVVVDYLQLMRSDSNRFENRTQEVSEASRGLKLLAGEIGAPVLAASQLNRSIESRQGASRRPQLSDLRDSGSVEQDANVVLFINRESTYDPAAAPDEAELLVGKNRQGKSGVTIPLSFAGETVSFSPVKYFTSRPEF
jgi:replicative DNA helicase